MTHQEKLKIIDSILDQFGSLIKAKAESKFPKGEQCQYCDPECGFECMDCVTVSMCQRLAVLLKEKEREGRN
jgi:hypothetical protein